jgi:hypothetical protein
LANHSPAHKRIATREHEGGIDIIVICLWRWQFTNDTEGWGRGFVVHIAGEAIGKPISCERAPALHPFVILTGIIDIIEVVVLRSVGDVEIRKIIRGCFGTKFVLNVVIKFEATLNMRLVCPLSMGEGAVRQLIDNLPVCFEDLGRESRANIDCWSEISTKHWVVIWECHWLITKHDPVIEREFAELADIGCLTRHHRFYNFPPAGYKYHVQCWSEHKLRAQSRPPKRVLVHWHGPSFSRQPSSVL